MELTDEIREALRAEADPLHSYYEQAGILIARPVANGTCRMAVSVKGGHNAENHNHNDVGSYAVSLGKETMAGDQGGPFSYPGDYFDRNATEKYKIKGSYGHPVPVVDGVMQKNGRQAQGVILEKQFTDAKDVFRIDYTSAYPVPQLSRLIRTFNYDRSGAGSFTVNDEFTATSPVRFETALTTAAAWKVVDGKHIELTCGDEQMIVTIDASGPVEFTSEIIEVNAPAYTRIGIALKNKAEKGYIRQTMCPKRP